MSSDLERAISERDYSSLKLWEVEWKTFARDSQLDVIADINAFRFYAQLSGIGRWSGLINSSKVAIRLLASIEEAITEAGFMNIPAIETIIEPEGIAFRYADSDFGFDLIFRGSGSVELRRGGSRLETFHRWYTGFMPSMPAILLTCMTALDDEVHHSLHGVARKQDKASSGDEESAETVRILEGGFSFNVVCYDFKLKGSHKNNLDVMRENVAVRLPDPSGVMGHQLSPIDLDRYGRMDYKVSLRHEKVPAVTQFLTVEAPSNADWGALFFRMDYVGENFFRGRRDIREALDPQLFLSSAVCSDAYISFFRDIGLRGFLRSVTEGFEFKTSSSGIL